MVLYYLYCFLAYRLENALEILIFYASKKFKKKLYESKMLDFPVLMYT